MSDFLTNDPLSISKTTPNQPSSTTTPHQTLNYHPTRKKATSSICSRRRPNFSPSCDEELVMKKTMFNDEGDDDDGVNDGDEDENDSLDRVKKKEEEDDDE